MMGMWSRSILALAIVAATTAPGISAQDTNPADGEGLVVDYPVFNPVQPEVTDHAWLRKTFGNNLAYYGGVSTQSVMPFGSPDKVKATVRECAQTLAPDHTGLLIAPSHRMMVDIPMENVGAFMEASAELRTAE